MYKFLFIILFFLPSFSIAQTTVMYSEAFPEPETPRVKLYALKNGNTIFLNLTGDYIEVKLYGKDRKRIIMQKIEHTKWTDNKGGGIDFTAIHEINNQLVIFMNQQKKKNTPVLIAVYIDGVTGQYSGSKEIMSIGPDREWRPYTVVVGEESENYAIVYPGDKKQTNYKFVIFDKNHARVGEVALVPENFDKLNIKNVSFSKDELHVFYNNIPLKSKELKQTLFFAKFKIQDKQFSTTNLAAEVYSNPVRSSFLYNKVNGLYQIVLMAKVDSKTKSKMLGNVNEITVFYGTELLYISPSENKIVGQFEIGGKDLDDYARQTLLIKNGFNGMYNNQIVNNDGSTDMLFQETSYVSGNSSTSTNDGNLGILRLNENGKLTDKYIIRKAQITGSGAMRDWYKLEQYFSYSYFLNSEKVGYVVFNDLPENYNKSLSDEPHPIQTISDANAVLYKLSGNKVERTYLFGNPKDKFNTKFAMSGSAIYNSADDTYITVMVDNKKGKKNAHIAWIKI